MKFSLIWVCMFGVLLTSTIGFAGPRTWTDVNHQQWSAYLVDEADPDQVKMILQPEGTILQVPLDQLCEADKNFIASELKSISGLRISYAKKVEPAEERSPLKLGVALASIKSPHIKQLGHHQAMEKINTLLLDFSAKRAGIFFVIMLLSVAVITHISLILFKVKNTLPYSLLLSLIFVGITVVGVGIMTLFGHHGTSMDLLKFQVICWMVVGFVAIKSIYELDFLRAIAVDTLSVSVFAGLAFLAVSMN